MDLYHQLHYSGTTKVSHFSFEFRPGNPEKSRLRLVVILRSPHASFVSTLVSIAAGIRRYDVFSTTWSSSDRSALANRSHFGFQNLLSSDNGHYAQHPVD